MKRRVVAVALAALQLCSPAFAQDKALESPQASKAEALKAFKSMVAEMDMAFFTCSLSGANTLLRISMGRPGEGEKVTQCIGDAKARASSSYKRVKEQVSGDKDATSALNDYAANLLAALDDLEPRPGESDRSYKYRVANSERDIKAKANFVNLQLQ